MIYRLIATFDAKAKWFVRTHIFNEKFSLNFPLVLYITAHNFYRCICVCVCVCCVVFQLSSKFLLFFSLLSFRFWCWHFGQTVNISELNIDFKGWFHWISRNKYIDFLFFVIFGWCALLRLSFFFGENESKIDEWWK